MVNGTAPSLQLVFHGISETRLDFKTSFGFAGNTKGGSITVQLTSCLTGLESAVWQLTIFVFIYKTDQFQTSQTGGEWYSDTIVFPFSIPWFMYALAWLADCREC